MKVKTTCNRDCPDACGIVATVEGDRVARVNHYFDMMTLLTQIGAAPKS